MGDKNNLTHIVNQLIIRFNNKKWETRNSNIKMQSKNQTLLSNI